MEAAAALDLSESGSGSLPHATSDSTSAVDRGAIAPSLAPYLCPLHAGCPRLLPMSSDVQAFALPICFSPTPCVRKNAIPSEETKNCSWAPIFVC